MILAVALATGFMAYQSQFVEWSFTLANVVPDHDPDMMEFRAFKDEFGEDGNILAIGIKDSSVYQYENFSKLHYMTEAFAGIRGVNDVVSLTNLKKLVKDQDAKRFRLEKVFDSIPQDQKTLDSMVSYALGLKFYSGQLINSENGACMVLVTIEKDIMNSKIRDVVVGDVLDVALVFEENTGIDLRFAGLPFVRFTNTSKLKQELVMFLILSVVVTSFILFLFFRSVKAVAVPLLIIAMIVIWVLGTLSLLGYKITLLTGLIPPIIVVIGIPNAVYMLNKYHQGYFTHGDKTKALRRIIRKIGIVTLITNFTTAVGFLVLAFTDIVVLREFGIVAGINILATFVLSLILLPAFFSYMKPPSDRHLKHLEFKPLDKVLTGLDLLVHRHKFYIFNVTGIIVLACIFGISKIKAVSFMVDDLPEDSQEKLDLKFFEENFSGVMPLEVIIDTNVKKGVQNIGNLRKIDKFETFLDSLENISKPMSVVSFIKATRQAFYNDKQSYYSLPNNRDKNFIFRYLTKESDEEGIADSFVDSTGQKIRVSLKMADIGSVKMDSLINQIIQPRIDSIFSKTKMDVKLTGTTLLFIKGNKFLIDNLITSMIIAFVVIAIIMGVLFKNFQMIILSLIPNIIPLMITGGMMGFAGIPLKPSTALIFSIAFGISVDDSIHFLAKYRQELFANNFFVPVAVSKSLRETGASMIYTSIILFFGFIIFAASDFGGTVALGLLTSTTLLMAMLTNLIVLPALLLRFDSGKRNVKSHPLIERFPEFYHEDEDEEIDLNLIKVKNDTSI